MSNANNTQQEPVAVASVSRNLDESLTFTPLCDFYVTNGMLLYAGQPPAAPVLSDEDIFNLLLPIAYDSTWDEVVATGRALLAKVTKP